MDTTNLNYNNPSNEEQEITFADIIGMVIRYKWWYVGVTAFCLFVAAFYLYRTPDLYQRTTKVMVDDSDQDAAMRNLGMVSSSMMRLRSYNSVENEIEAFASPDLMQVVVERLGLQTRYVEQQILRNVELYHNSPIAMSPVGSNPLSSYSFTVSPNSDGTVSLSKFRIKREKINEIVTGRLGDTLSTPVGSIVIYPKDNLEDFTRDIRVSWANSGMMAKVYSGKLNISLSGKQTSVIVMSMQDQYPSRADAVLSSLVDVYNEVWIRNKNKSAINTAEFLNERLVIIEQDLNSVENALKEYKETNNLTDIKAVGMSYLEESSLYSNKAFEVRNQLSMANYIKDYLNDPVNATALIPSNIGLTDHSIQTQIKEYNELVLERDRLLASSSIYNPLVADLTSSLSAVRTAILGSVENMIATLGIQLEKIESQEKQILARLASSSGQELQLLSIEREQKMIQDLYVFLLQKREENELASLVNVGNTRMIMNPNGSPFPVSPNTKMVLLVAILLGCCIPFGFFFLRRMLDTTIKSKADLGNMTIPFLVELPRLVSEKDRRNWLKRRNDNDKNFTRIIVEKGSRDMVNEAFRVLRTNVDLMLDKTKGCNVLMFTSFNPNDGKTFSVMNLAASMALKDSKVLMLDLDLRKASLGKALDVEHAGSASYLNGKLDDYHECITEITGNLHIIPVGSLPPNPTELLLTDRFKEMIAKLRQEYDYIFIDCPPIELVADASIITTVADMSIFVLRANYLDKRAVPYIEELYASGKYNHMALILNGVDMVSRRYGYGKGGFGYGYGYGYGYGNSK